MDIYIGAYTDAGKVRVVNQDRALATKRLFAVADGMGGHVGGEVAAELALEELVKSFKTDPTGKGLAAAIRGANLAVWTKGMDDTSLRGMGTTLTAGTIGDDENGPILYLSHVGDSRAYILRDGELSQLTEDHTVVEELVRQGKLTESQAQVDKRRHTLTRALGVEPNVVVDSFKVLLQSGDIVLLCSDGLSNELSEDEIITLLSSDHPVQQKAEDLVRLAKAHGGRDNITTVVVEMNHPTPDSDQNDLAELPVGNTVSDSLEEESPVSSQSPEASTVGIEETAIAVSGVTEAKFLRSGDSADEATLLDFPAYNAGKSSEGINEENIDNDMSTVAVKTVDKGSEATSTNQPQRTKQKGTLIFDLTDEHDETEQIDSNIPFLTFRTIIFVALIVAVALSAYGAVKWYSDNSYYVGLSGNSIAIYHGRPHGQYFFTPKLVATSNLTTNDVLPNQVSALQSGVEVTSLNSAYHLIDALKAQEKKIGLAAGGTTTTTIPFSQLLTQTT